ncbi:KH domain-containing protein 3 [Erinaceus europaeus]|uniref:KH domain-containing protein 3 n=1 Tax=Erinaceus europaeus TaxID=9365 RepID=A0ABM3YJC0_ERIEU|nr:KH domain-containing protein 3 [Erinaceus europaeus]
MAGAVGKQFPSILPLERGEGNQFKPIDTSKQPPNWFYPEYLKNPYQIHLKAWLVEAIFGQDGNRIPHTEWVSQTLLHVSRWDPKGEAEILIFGTLEYQKDVDQMIMSLASHHRRRSKKTKGRKQGSTNNNPQARAQQTHDATQQEANPCSSQVQEATADNTGAVGIQGTQPHATQDAGILGSPEVTQLSPKAVGGMKRRFSALTPEADTQSLPSTFQEAEPMN